MVERSMTAILGMSKAQMTRLTSACSATPRTIDVSRRVSDTRSKAKCCNGDGCCQGDGPGRHRVRKTIGRCSNGVFSCSKRLCMLLSVITRDTRSSDRTIQRYNRHCFQLSPSTTCVRRFPLAASNCLMLVYSLVERYVNKLFCGVCTRSADDAEVYITPVAVW